MALGRSNSLSLNTSAVNSSFAAQQPQQGQQSQAPPAAGGTFGGSLFGNQQNKPQATGGTSLFGAQPTTQASQPAPGGGLFGGTAASNQNAQQPAGSNSIFGGQQNQQQPSAAVGGGSLFGGQQSQQQPSGAVGGGLFGGSQQPKPLGGSLFGATQNTQQAGLFGASQNNANQQHSNSLFGSLNQAQSHPMHASLLGASQYSVGQPAPFTGRLTMGQGNSTQNAAPPAAKLSWDNVRQTTRFSDLVDPAKEQLEAIDKMIQQQETWCKQIEAFMPVHGSNLDTLKPDVLLIADKCAEAEQALVTDAQGVQLAKDLSVKDAKNLARCERIGENLRLPSQYQYAPAASIYGARNKQIGSSASDSVLDDSYDTELINNYFNPMTSEMRRLLSTYEGNLGEIENHMQIIEASTIAQAQRLSQQRARGELGDDSVRQLADALRGFEGTILATAAKVGACREGTTEITLGRIGGTERKAGAW